ncbi:DNA topoisomerase [Apophysomyces ossiformis]|uniref:DNA topoisomerase n=1 Tax=Apophysomyces ossiformis TaxID=679940 RepID=A0A8H7BPN3_9FUNG|nr:DNA topoisomerase [Apophysomyces ossiformis]
MRVLCVAEKPSAAKKIAGILSQSSFQTNNTSDTYIKNYIFNYTFNQRSAQVTMTSLRGHAMQLDFDQTISKNWRACDPEDLFEAPVYRTVSEDAQAIANNLRQQARTAEILFIWTDCDREGEAIGAEVVEICQTVNRRLQVWRARFSAMQPEAIHRAAREPTTMDERQVDAVFARSELDLRIGAAFTRFQTLKLRPFFHEDRKVVSYGSCQFPTLGFVVDRYISIKNFVPEPFWKIDMSYTQPTTQNKDREEPITTKFHWKRGQMFDRWSCFVLYEMCYQNPMATVTRVRKKETKKWKPLPLTTVEMQKVCCRALRMTGEQIMKVAEELYTSGLISYPRTETDQFDKGFQFRPLIQMQSNDPRWGQYAQLLLDGEFENPRNGRNNDKAHPPIHPTGYDATLQGNHRSLYEFIVRRFLGCCWKNAIGYETSVDVKIAEEEFDAKGLVIVKRNYLEVYTYDKWEGKFLPEFRENDEFMPTVLEMNSSVTQAPSPLTEYDLITLMEKNGIGTDATIAEHIQKILDRRYAFKRGQHFHPCTLGIALVLGYDEIGFDSSLSKPFLRQEMEADLKRICEGKKDKSDVLRQSVQRYRQMFIKSVEGFPKMVTSMEQYYRPNEDQLSFEITNQNGNNNNASAQHGNNSNGGRSGRGSRGGRGGRGSRGGQATRGNRQSQNRGSGSRARRPTFL